jgi:hypothetical protein
MKRIFLVAAVLCTLASCGDYSSADANGGGDSASINPSTTGGTNDSLTEGSGGTGRIGTDTSKAGDTLNRRDSLNRP